MSDVGKLMRKVRGKDSLRMAGEKTGISHNYLSIVEKGIDPRSGSPIKPSPDTLKSFATGYNYSYNELMKAAGYLTSQSKAEGLVKESKTTYDIIDERKRKYFDMYDKLPKDKQNILDQLAEVMLKELAEKKGKDH